MTVSVIIPTVRPHTLKAAVESIRRQSYGDLEIIVVAQGSDPALRAVTDELSAADPRVRIVRLEQGNLSAARNAGIAAGSGDILAFTDDDCEADPRWIEVMVQIFRERPEIGLVGGEVVAPKARPLSISTCPSAQVKELSYQPSKSGWEAPHGLYLIGANMGLRRSVFERVGPFDPSMGAGTYYASCEDVDYGLRCELADVGILTSPRLIIHHTHGRRYGLASFLKHHRNYANGRGALVVKLRWMNHRLAPIWGAPRSPRDHLASIVKNPAKWLLDDLYGRYYQRKAAESFAADYELTSSCICVKRPPASRGDMDGRPANGGRAP
jgi:GT2 family glycosyltransferase